MADMSREDLGLKGRRTPPPPGLVHFAGVNRAVGENLNTALVDLYKAWMRSRAPAKGSKSAKAVARIDGNRETFLATMLAMGFRIVPQSLIDIDWT